jgi:hypothetical protein
VNRLPRSIDRMPLEARKPRAGPLLDPDEAIALSLNGVPFEWWKHMPLSENSVPVREILNGLRIAGWKIVPR